MANVHEAIEACLHVDSGHVMLWDEAMLVVEEKKNRGILAVYHPRELSLHTITLSL